MAYTPGQPFSYGIPDGTYRGIPTTASCFEKDGKLILDVNFAVIDPQTGETYKNDKGYDWEARKRHWLTNKDGGFNEATINGIKEWSKGWNPQKLEDFWWHQSPDANGVPFGNLKAIGEVELNFQIDKTGNQQLWVHDPNRTKGVRKALVPEGCVSDAAQLQAKWGAKAKALFAATPKKLGATAGEIKPAATTTAPNRELKPTAPTKTAGKDWDDYPKNADGAFSYFCSKLGEKYDASKHDERWFSICDAASEGKDPDQFTQADWDRMFAMIHQDFLG